MIKRSETIVDDSIIPPRLDEEEIDNLKKEIEKLKAKKIALTCKTKKAKRN